ncbi:hypothetical protein D3C72_1918350 [compost metagenome]
MRDAFQQAFGAGALEVDHFEVDHVPLDIAGLDLGLDLGHAAGIVLEQHLGAAVFLERVDDVFLLCRAIGAAPGHHGQTLLGAGGEAGRA